MNSITQGGERNALPNKDGVIDPRPNPALDDLKAEIARASALKASNQAAEGRAHSDIVSRTDLRLAAVNELSKGDPQRTSSIDIDRNTAKQWADLDAAEFGRLRAPLRKEAALESIAGHMRLSPEYAEEMKKRSPVLAEAATNLNEERLKLEAQAAREAAEQRKNNETAASAATREALFAALAIASVAKVRHAQTESASKALGMDSPALTSSGFTSLRASGELPATPVEIQARKSIERNADELAAIPRNQLNAEAARVAAREDLAALRSIKDPTERYFAAATVSGIASDQKNYKEELKRQDPVIAKEVDKAGAENQSRINAKDDRKAQEYADMTAPVRASKRPIDEADLAESLLKRFIVAQEKKGLFDRGQTEFVFRHGDKQGEVAFVDAGKNLSTTHQDKETVRAMIEVAMAKNWKEVTVSGTTEFKRAAWLEASLNGLEVKGYVPREADKKMLAEVKERNTVESTDKQPRREEVVVPRGKQGPAEHINGDTLTTPEKAVLTSSRALLKDQSPAVEQAVMRELESRLRGERVYIGELVAHGGAKYKFDDKNDPSYFVTLKTAQGEKTVWGKHLGTAMEKSDLKQGDQIVLRNTGHKDVEVQERIFDAAGKVTGTRSKVAPLNEWTADPLSRFSEKAREQIDDRSKNSVPQMAAPVQQAARNVDAIRPPPDKSR